MLISAVPVEASSQYEAKLIIDNQQVTIPAGDQAPVIIQGRTYVPLRIISENLGTRVEWLHQSKQVIIVTNQQIPFPIPTRAGEGFKDVQIVVDGKILDIPTSQGEAFVTASNRTVVPLRAVGEALGCQVNWQQENRLVEITSTPKIPDPPIVVAPENPLPQPVTNSGLLQALANHRTNLKLMDGKVINSAELANMNDASFSSEQMTIFKTYQDQLSKYNDKVTLPDGTVLKIADITITGRSIATADQLRDWIAAETPRIKTKMAQANREFVPIPDLAEFYIEIGEAYGIRGDLAFAQAAKETHYWQFTGIVQPWQNNYCGLSATGSASTGNESLNGSDPAGIRFEKGVHGAIFDSPEIGVEAHIQHLYAYAVKDQLPTGKVLYDPRYTLVSRGISPTWLGLNARWAVPGTTYGQSIIQDYWLPTLKY